MSILRRLSRQDILTILKERKQIRSKHFSIIYSDNKEGYTIVVGKKVEKLAVNRNKTKRRVSSILRTFNVTQGSFVIFVKSKITKLPYKDIQKELQSLIMRLQ